MRLLLVRVLAAILAYHSGALSVRSACVVLFNAIARWHVHTATKARFVRPGYLAHFGFFLLALASSARSCSRLRIPSGILKDLTIRSFLRRIGLSPAFTATLSIHGSTAIHLNQSLIVGMRPQSSMTCCSPINRTGTSLPSEFLMVTPNTRSHSNIPSA